MDILEHLTIIWIGALLAFIFARMTRLTPVLFYLFMGALFVNLGLLPVQPDPFIQGFAEIGIILIMFALGFEENTANFIAGMKRSWGIAFFGGLAPFLTAYFLADYFWDDANISLMVGLTMTATAVSLTLISLKAEGLHRTPAATGIMTSAVLDDIASLALIAILIPIATGEATLSVASIGLILLKAAGFFAVIAVLASWILPTEPKGPFHFIPGLGRFGIAHIFAFASSQHTLVILIFVMTVAIMSHLLGLHPAVGAYMAGLILREEYFPKAEDNKTSGFKFVKDVIDNTAFVWIGPVFFITLGTKIIFDLDLLVSVMPHVIMLTLALITAQIMSAGLAARYTGGFNGYESVMIGLGMLGRAELAFVVIDIGYVQHNILSEEAFYTLMVTAFFLNMAVPLSIRLWKPYFEKHTQFNKQNGE